MWLCYLPTIKQVCTCLSISCSILCIDVYSVHDNFLQDTSSMFDSRTHNVHLPLRKVFYLFCLVEISQSHETAGCVLDTTWKPSMNGVHQGHLEMCRSAMQELLNLFSSLKISKTENETKIRGIGGCDLGSQYYWCIDAGRWFWFSHQCRYWILSTRVIANSINWFKNICTL